MWSDRTSTTAQLNLPQGTATGTYYVIARADGANAIVERSETNNNRSASFKVGPDLIVSGISAATAGVAGANITVNTVNAPTLPLPWFLTVLARPAMRHCCA